MSEEKTFPCLACGAPVNPLEGVTQMACAYCGVTLAIPEALQKDLLPPGSRFKIPEQEPDPEMDAAEFLRAAQPVARKAFNLFALWTWVRRFIPGCLLAISIATCLCLVGIAILVLQQGG